MNNQTELGLATNETKSRSTAIYPNRAKDKAQVEAFKKLQEFGDEETKFLTPKGNPFATGYNRIVYGDHGPYVEFERHHITCDMAPRYPRPAGSPLPEKYYYEWLVPADNSLMKIYDQKKDVKALPNPPAGGFRGNRPEGYADYLPGKIYVSPTELKIPHGNIP